MDNRQFYFDIIDSCCSESNKHLKHIDKLVCVDEMIKKYPDSESISFFILKNFVFVRFDMDRFWKVKQIAKTLGIPISKYSK